MGSIVLSDLQNKARKGISEWYRTFNVKKKPYYVLAGLAGSGKTSCVSYILEDLGITKEVTIAYTGMAACVLLQKGNINSSTFHKFAYNTRVIEDKETKRKKFIIELKTKEELDTVPELIIVDEYSMLPDNMVKDILTFEIPVLFVGDPAQLDPIFGKNSLDYDFFLDEPHRQALGNPILEIANYARKGEFHKIRLGDYGHGVHVYSKDDFPMEVLTEVDQIIACKNATVNTINTIYRREILGLETNDITDGDKIMCIANNWEVENDDAFALVNGLIGYASNISIKPKAQLYELDFTPTFTSSFSKVIIDKFKFEGGDIPPKKLDLFRSPLKEKYGTFNEFKYGYCITCHKSQGSGWPSVTFFAEKLGGSMDLYKKLLYTGITRAESRLNLII